MMVLVLTVFCGSPGACNRKQRTNWRNEGRGRHGMGRFLVGFRTLVGRIVNEVFSITSWKVGRREGQKVKGHFLQCEPKDLVFGIIFALLRKNRFVFRWIIATGRILIC
jgi:hypothetical protein